MAIFYPPAVILSRTIYEYRGGVVSLLINSWPFFEPQERAAAKRKRHHTDAYPEQAPYATLWSEPHGFRIAENSIDCKGVRLTSDIQIVKDMLTNSRALTLQLLR